MPISAKSTLSDRIRDCANMAGSGDELSRKTGVPRRTLENYLSGKSEPKASVIAEICTVLDVSAEWLLTGEGSMQLNKVVTLDKTSKSADNYNWNAAGLANGRVWLEISQEVTFAQFFEISKILESESDDG